MSRDEIQIAKDAVRRGHSPVIFTGSARWAAEDVWQEKNQGGKTSSLPTSGSFVASMGALIVYLGLGAIYLQSKPSHHHHHTVAAKAPHPAHHGDAKKIHSAFSPPATIGPSYPSFDYWDAQTTKPLNFYRSNALVATNAGPNTGDILTITPTPELVPVNTSITELYCTVKYCGIDVAIDRYNNLFGLVSAKDFAAIRKTVDGSSAPIYSNQATVIEDTTGSSPKKPNSIMPQLGALPPAPGA